MSTANDYTYSNSFKRNMTKFIFTAGLGLFIFFVPVAGKLPFEFLYKDVFLKIILGSFVMPIIMLIPWAMFFGYLYAKNFAKSGSFFDHFFMKSGIVHLLMYGIACAFTIMWHFKVGFEAVYDKDIGGIMIADTLPIVVAISPVASAVLPLLASFGLLELVGILLEPLMRPLFKVPGKSALDMVTSIVGAAVVGILLTSNLYKRNEYTNREALFIATNFSLNSVGYCAFLLTYVALSHAFGAIFFGYCIVTGIIAAILVRIPPLSRYPDTYADHSVQTDAMRFDNTHLNKAQFKKAFTAAMRRCDRSEAVLPEVGVSFLKGCAIVMELIPMMMSIGVIGLMICKLTPTIAIMSAPLEPIIRLLGIPEAKIAAEAIMLGGIDLFLPSVLIKSVTVEATRFFVCVVSLVQVLYISETMLPVLFFGIPVKFRDILIIFVQRTILALPLVAALTWIFYPS